MYKKLILLISIITLAFATPVSAKELNKEYKDFVAVCSKTMEVDAYVVMALIETESGNNPLAVNADGTCYGLAQIHQCHRSRALDLGYGDPTTSWESNIAYCTYLLSGYVKEYDGDYDKALVAYNAGYCYADSSPYSRKILSRADDLRQRDLEKSKLPY